MIAVLVALTALFINLGSVVTLYDKIIGGPTYDLKVQVLNNSEAPIEITSLLDFYITRTEFYSGRLVGGEAPTGRIKLQLHNEKNIQSPHQIHPGDSRLYVVEFKGSPYKHDLGTGGSTIVFVLNLERSNTVYYFEKPFQTEVMASIFLSFEIG